MGTREERHRHHHDLVPLAALISRELKNEKMEKPKLRYGSSAQSRKGEDYFLIKTDCVRVPGNPSTSFSVFGLFAYAYNTIYSLVLFFVGKTSGTTATFVIVDGWTVTVASVGDSRCILDAQGGAVSELTVDHRLEENIGPLRCWPGGLCLSRSIGDMDVGEFIVPIPHVKQVKLSSVGGRLIIASDGVWDALSSEMAAKSCRGLPAELAAKLVVKEALKKRGLKDDTTCLVVDIIPPDNAPPSSIPPHSKKYNKLQGLLFRKKSWKSASKVSNKLSAVGIVEELFEEGSAMLSERLGNDDTSDQTRGIFICAVCQTDLAPNDGISVHAGYIFSMTSTPWRGPFLCADCRYKKDAMEGKRRSRVKVI
ncbi:hypothetical protein ACJIZ3_019676 [Penstemon smallii]|uniref:PPM-type phosphatase domain-containing protein n=1 Tax=Penstemon smallii TaxID=265156 RepID=A0ABD3T1U0_9LAMI